MGQVIDNYLPGGGFDNAGGSMARALGGQAPHDPDEWVRWRQPFLSSDNRACLSVRDLDGRFTVNDSTGGERKPLLTTYTIQDLCNRGLRVPVTANAATLPIRAWIEFEEKIQRSYRQRLRAAEDLSASSSYGGFNAMGRMTLESQRASDPGEAIVDMYGAAEGRRDTPLLDTISLPLPITFSDFGYMDRELQVSQSGNLPLDTFMVEAAGRRIGESIEDQTIGNVTGVTYGTQSTGYGAHTGTSTVYGYKNFTSRLTKINFTVPTGSNASVTFAEVNAALDQLYANFVYGPFLLYHSIDWTQYMNGVFSVSGGNHPGETLRSMLLKIDGITDVRRLDRLTSTFTLLFVAMRSDVAQMVNGMGLSIVAWQLRGGLEHRWRAMTITVPRMRADYSSRTGILHGTTA